MKEMNKNLHKSKTNDDNYFQLPIIQNMSVYSAQNIITVPIKSFYCYCWYDKKNFAFII